MGRRSRVALLLAPPFLGCVQPPSPGTTTGEEEECTLRGCALRCLADGRAGGACGADGSCVCEPRGGVDRERRESCGDGDDDNGNGEADEWCTCRPGAKQACFSGPARARGKGACRDGMQVCLLQGEFTTWSACMGETLPGPESCGNGVDDDCDWTTDEGCPPPCVATEYEAETACFDAIDNECDGLTDCEDPDCWPCTPGEESCGNGVDDDWDGLSDCEDEDCCEEAECRESESCRTLCCVPGTRRYCDVPLYCSWGRQTCRPDGHWGACEETTDRPEGLPWCDGGSYYSPGCCFMAGWCCQNYGYDPSLPWDASIGECEGVVAECP
jgi:hypothetical protein